jgi:hypothetical protein
MRYPVIVPTVLLAAACGGGANPGGGTAPPMTLPPTTTPATTPPATMPPTTTQPPAPTPTVVRAATIRGAAGHSASGSARIVREGSSYYLELGGDFRIDSGNNDVMLTRQPDTRTGTDLNLGNMRSLTGRQRYDLPNDGSSYSFVMLWCRPFQIPIGVGELR